MRYQIDGQTGKVQFTPDAASYEPDPRQVAEAEIGRLKRALAESDYKIIKCAEYGLSGLEPPYEIDGLHMERQNIRDRINEMEAIYNV